MTQLLGAHVSSSGGYNKMFERIKSIGGNCVQLFASSPRTWANASVDEASAQLFRQLQKDYAVSKAYFHASYLINLADPQEGGKKSIRSLIHELTCAHDLGVIGSVIHTGSFKNGKVEHDIRTLGQFPTLIENIKSVLAETPQDTRMILENAGTRKIGKTLEDLSSIAEKIHSPRLVFCLDTCHLHAAGYDLRTPDAFAMFLKTVERLIGLDHVELWHLNDSRDRFGSLRDRHENIGQGNVGTEVFRNILLHPKTCKIPAIIETPGFDGKGPDKQNLDILKAML